MQESSHYQDSGTAGKEEKMAHSIHNKAQPFHSNLMRKGMGVGLWNKEC